MKANPKQPVVFCDFDGTITQADVTDRVLEEFASPAWRQVEDEWVRGLIGSRECLERQMALVDASEEQLDALIDSIPLTPGFTAFHQFTRGHGIPLYVVSDGFDHVIRRLLRRSGVRGPLQNGSHLFASALHIEGRRLAASFPQPLCAHGCATCKAAILKRVGRRRHPVIFIGDGLSDRFAVERADVVFAKRQLLEYCRAHRIACDEFETFADVQTKLGSLALWRDKKSPGASRQGAKTRRAVTMGRLE